MSGAGERLSVVAPSTCTGKGPAPCEATPAPCEGRAPSSCTGKGPAPHEPSPALSRPPSHDGSEEEWEEAKEEVEEKKEEEELELYSDETELWKCWPAFSKRAVPWDRDRSRKSQVMVLRCQEHKAWYIWHPPRPGGCALCPGGLANIRMDFLKENGLHEYKQFMVIEDRITWCVESR